MQPVGAVRDSGAEEVDDGNVPAAPKEAEEDGCAEGREFGGEFWEGEAGPADFLEDARGNAEREANPETIG